MSNPMSFQEFANIVKHIQHNNSPLTRTGGLPNIKYIDPVLDMRTNSVFAITFRGFGNADTTFHTQNECMDLKETLYERVMSYLITPIHSVKGEN